MVRLNQDLKQRKDVQFKKALLLSENELISLALDEEEKLASTSGDVYANVVKNRIAAYRKMKPEDWITHIKTTPLLAAKQTSAPRPPPKLDPLKPIDTGLTPAQELAVLHHLVVKDQSALAKHGYIPYPPTPEAAAAAAAATEASWNYELCDRCTARFQVFPHRTPEGLLTSNGTCRHHPNRKFFPPRTKADTGPKEPYYPCCGNAVGSPGCTDAEHHVFKTDNPARLAS
ncbi:RNA exonuclease 3, partial [Teratosphaeriaceae sp. CCFEE 6253]